MTTALGSAVSPQASRQVRRSRSSSRRHRPRRVQRENRVNSVLNGMSQSCPMLHATEAETPDRHDRLAQGRTGQRRLRPRPCRPRALHRCEFRQNLIHEGVHVAKGVPGSWRRLGGSDGGTHMLLARRLLTTALDIARQPPTRHSSFQLKVASRSAQAGTPRLRTGSEAYRPGPCQADHGQSALPVGGGSRLPGYRAGGCSGRGPRPPSCVTGAGAGVGLKWLRFSERILSG